jgi:hypothetical protein
MLRCLNDYAEQKRLLVHALRLLYSHFIDKLLDFDCKYMFLNSFIHKEHVDK